MDYNEFLYLYNKYADGNASIKNIIMYIINFKCNSMFKYSFKVINTTTHRTMWCIYNIETNEIISSIYLNFDVDHSIESYYPLVNDALLKIKIDYFMK